MEVKNLNLVMLILGIILVTIAGTYAYFISNTDKNKNEIIKVTAGTMELSFNDVEDENVVGNLEFGDSIDKYFVIENTGSLDAVAKVSFHELVNTYTDGSLTYTLSYATSDAADSYVQISTNLISKNVPVSEKESTFVLADGLVIPAETTYYYKLTVTLEYLDNIDQTSDFDAIFYTRFTLDQGNKVIAL